MLRSLLLLLMTFTLVSTSLYSQSKLVEGKFLDEKTMRPIDELEVALKNTTNGKTIVTETDADGIFKFKNIPFGIQEICVVIFRRIL